MPKYGIRVQLQVNKQPETDSVAYGSDDELSVNITGEVEATGAADALRLVAADVEHEVGKRLGDEGLVIKIPADAALFDERGRDQLVQILGDRAVGAALRLLGRDWNVK
jgi:hypothetical protein